MSLTYVHPWGPFTFEGKFRYHDQTGAAFFRGQGDGVRRGTFPGGGHAPRLAYNPDDDEFLVASHFNGRPKAVRALAYPEASR